MGHWFFSFLFWFSFFRFFYFLIKIFSGRFDTSGSMIPLPRYCHVRAFVACTRGAEELGILLVGCSSRAVSKPSWVGRESWHISATFPWRPYQLLIHPCLSSCYSFRGCLLEFLVSEFLSLVRSFYRNQTALFSVANWKPMQGSESV